MYLALFLVCPLQVSVGIFECTESLMYLSHFLKMLRGFLDVFLEWPERLPLLDVNYTLVSPCWHSLI